MLTPNNTTEHSRTFAYELGNIKVIPWKKSLTFDFFKYLSFVIMPLFEMCDKKTYGTVLLLESKLVKDGSVRAMVPILCVFLFLNAATVRGISGQIHGINIKFKVSIDTLHRLKRFGDSNSPDGRVYRSCRKPNEHH